MHVVFGHVVSGHDLVRQLEQLPVDRNSRPLQDATISNCGELVRLVKGEIVCALSATLHFMCEYINLHDTLMGICSQKR